MTLRSSRSAALLVLGALLALLGGSGLWVEAARAERTQHVAAWPTAEGEVVYSGVDRRMPRQRRLALWPLAPEAEHRAVVRYRYAVGGTPYLSDQIALAPARGHRTESDARLEASRYAVGEEVQVRFDPERPGTAVLRVEPPLSLWRLGLGGLGVLLGLACIGGAARSARGRGATEA